MGEEQTLGDVISSQIQYELNKTPKQLGCTVVNNYNDSNYVDIQLDDTGEILKYTPVVGDNSIGAKGVLCFLDGDENNRTVITSNGKANEINTILALGLGLFTIKDDGHLWVELPMGMNNPFSITDGHLIVSIPEGANNDYEIIDKHLIYHRGG